MLCDQLAVGLNCCGGGGGGGVVVLWAPGCPVSAEEGMVIHTRPPKILTSLGTGQSQRHNAILGLPLHITEDSTIQFIGFTMKGDVGG